DLAMVVRQHGPEAPQSAGRNRYAELGQIALQEGLDEALPPFGAGPLGPGEIAARKAAAQPEPREVWDTDFRERKAAEWVVEDPPGQGFGRLAEQLRRGATQDQELRRPWAVDQDAQSREELRTELDLVEDDASPQVLE